MLSHTGMGVEGATAQASEPSTRWRKIKRQREGGLMGAG